jgi:hypothetical protein
MSQRFHDTFSVPLDTDDKGYFDRECPSDECLFVFKVNQEDWKNLFREEEVFCPQCGHSAPSDHWHTQAQLRHAEKEAKIYMEREFQKMLKGVARDFNRSQRRDSFITMSMKVTGGPYRSYTLPAPAMEAFQLDIACEFCNSRFSVIGSAFFCPCCGRSSAERMFDASLGKTRAKFEQLETVRAALENIGQMDKATDLCRSILESCIQDLVGALQRLSEELYSRLQGVPSVPFNAFQRLNQSNDLWRSALGEGFEDWLDSSELAKLNVYYQKRHLLAHREGIVDAQYIQRSGDTSYREGQRIVVTPRDATEMHALVSRVADKLREQIHKGG